MKENKSIRIIDVTSKNMNEFAPTCFMRTAEDGYVKKASWLKRQFRTGLRVKLLYTDKDNKCIGFIEYAPGEYCWRGVDAKGYLFIHCIWVYGNHNKKHGYGSLLIKSVLEQAEQEHKLGVAVMTSNGPFMATKELFRKNGFKVTDSVKPSYDLLVKVLKPGKLPRFRDWEKQLKRYQGLNIVYSNQCPWVARGIRGMIATAKERGLKLKVFEMRNAHKAQNAPSVYATFNLIYNGRLLADHYISHHRFRNILDQELKMEDLPIPVKIKPSVKTGKK